MVDNYEIVLQKCIEQSMLNHVGWPVVITHAHILQPALN